MAAGAVAEQVATEIETVAGDLEQVASVARSLDGKMITSFTVGLGIGLGVGFYVGYRYNKKKLRAEIYADAEKEIAEVREMYQRKVIAAEAQAEKGDLENLVQEKGYVPEQEELPHTEYARLEEPTDEPGLQRIRPPGPVAPATRTGPPSSVPKDKDDDWDWETEIDKRDPDQPFVLHQDEYATNESGYLQSALTYYVIDDVLVDDSDPQTILSNRDRLIGHALDYFGHGADDYNTVYVRNSVLELEYEISRVRLSWEVEVIGRSPDEAG